MPTRRTASFLTDPSAQSLVPVSAVGGYAAIPSMINRAEAS